jgi:hypothetical protein
MTYLDNHNADPKPFVWTSIGRFSTSSPLARHPQIGQKYRQRVRCRFSSDASKPPPIHICGIFSNLVPAGTAESTACRAAMIDKFTGALLSQRLWCAASVARRAAHRLLSGLPDISHPFSDVAGPPDRPRCHANFAQYRS